MRMKNSCVIVLCLFTLGLITACQPVESITVDEISGVWQSQSDSSALLFLNADGTFYTPEFFGQWQLEGTTATFYGDDESPNCEGYSLSIQVEFIEEDKFKSILIEEDCPEELGGSGEDIWLRVSP